MPRAKLYKEEKVLEKAMQLFWREGYQATTIQDLVDYTGNQPGEPRSEFWWQVSAV